MQFLALQIFKIPDLNLGGTFSTSAGDRCTSNDTVTNGQVDIHDSFIVCCVRQSELRSLQVLPV